MTTTTASAGVDAGAVADATVQSNKEDVFKPLLAVPCAIGRLREEYLQWRLTHPLGFYARPEIVEHKPTLYQLAEPLLPTYIDGRVQYLNLRTWCCGIPGKSMTNLRDHYFDVRLTFPREYPELPPTIEFLHPALKTLSTIETICNTPFLDVRQHWTPSLTIPRILCGIQDLLYRSNFMNIQTQFVGTFTRHFNTPLPFYPFNLGYNCKSFFKTGLHSLPDIDGHNSENE